MCYLISKMMLASTANYVSLNTVLEYYPYPKYVKSQCYWEEVIIDFFCLGRDCASGEPMIRWQWYRQLW